MSLTQIWHLFSPGMETRATLSFRIALGYPSAGVKELTSEGQEWRFTCFLMKNANFLAVQLINILLLSLIKHLSVQNGAKSGEESCEAGWKRS